MTLTSKKYQYVHMENLMTKKTKILWLTKGLGTGGTENLLASSLPYLNREEFSYEVAYLLPWKNALLGKFEAQNIPVSCLNHKNPLDIRVIPKLTKFLKEHKPDILEIHLPYTGFLGRISAKLARIGPILYVEHSLAVQIGIRRFHILSFLGNILTYPLNDYIVTVSQDTCNDVKKYCFTKKPIQVVLNGIDIKKIEDSRTNITKIKQSFDIPINHKIVGHVANLLPKKRQDILLDAAKIVINEFPQVTFVLVGRGPLEQKLKSLTLKLGIQNNVIFPGFVDDLYGIMQTFDVFVMSSQYEGFGISLAEAMALGKPAVVTRVGGMVEVVEDMVSGFLVDAKTPHELAARILILLRNDDLRSTMGHAAEKRVREQFDIKKRVMTMENIYRKLKPSI